MTIPSRFREPVPHCSLQQWIFGSSSGTLPGRKKLFIDVNRPDTHFLTKADYRLLAKRIALGLLDAGLQRGDRVLLFAGSNLYYPALFLGVLMAGGVATGANPTFVARELAYQLQDAGAAFLVAAAGSLPTALAAADAVGLPRGRVYVLDEFADAPGNDVVVDDAPSAPAATATAAAAAGLRHWLALVRGNLRRALVWDWAEPADPAGTVCCLNYSSGTTGVPKGVAVSHRAYVANGVGVVAVGRDDPATAAQRARAVGLCFLPLYHGYGQTFFVANYPHMDIPVYLLPKFDLAAMLAAVQRFRVTVLPIVPPIAVLLAKSPAVRRYDLSSIESVGCGAAPLAKETQDAVQRLWPAARPVHVRQGWGMTEATCTCMGWAPDTQAEGASVGELVANAAARLVAVDDDDDGASSSSSSPSAATAAPRYITEAGKRGELWVTGPNLMTGYWNNPAATRATFHVDADGTRWLKTGDIAYVDRYAPGGTFFIVERRKELIKVKGSQVAPAELEALLLERPDVADAAVIGVTDAAGAERPRAFVVRVPGTAATADEIAAWLAQRVAPFKQLTGGVRFVDVIPKNPSGKILRKLLRDKAAQEGTAAKL